VSCPFQLFGGVKICPNSVERESKSIVFLVPPLPRSPLCPVQLSTRLASTAYTIYRIPHPHPSTLTLIYTVKQVDINPYCVSSGNHVDTLHSTRFTLTFTRPAPFITTIYPPHLYPSLGQSRPLPHSPVLDRPDQRTKHHAAIANLIAHRPVLISHSPLFLLTPPPTCQTHHHPPSPRQSKKQHIHPPFSSTPIPSRAGSIRMTRPSKPR
jgi:hypothetical protein